MKSALIYLLVGIAIAALAYFTYSLSSAPGIYDSFADCLTESGAVMYGTDWCHFCQEQKLMFGKSFSRVNYKNCDYEKQECDMAGARSYPTWGIKGVTYTGVQSLERLADLTNCSLE